MAELQVVGSSAAANKRSAVLMLVLVSNSNYSCCRSQIRKIYMLGVVFLGILSACELYACMYVCAYVHVQIQIRSVGVRQIQGKKALVTYSVRILYSGLSLYFIYACYTTGRRMEIIMY